MATWSPREVVQDGKQYLVDQETNLVYTASQQWPEVVGYWEGGQVKLKQQSTAGESSVTTLASSQTPGLRNDGSGLRS
jgi:hypothetical protein